MMNNPIHKYVGVAGITSLLIIGLLIIGGNINKRYNDYVNKCSLYDNVHSELNYYREAGEINDYYARFGIVTRIDVIKQTLEALDNLLPKYFPVGHHLRIRYSSTRDSSRSL